MYASVDGIAAALSNEEVIFQRRGTDQSQVMTHQVLHCLDQCRPFRSIDQHVAHVIRHVPGLTDPARARQGLEAMARSGLLVSDADYLARMQATAVDQAPLAALCIRACDRPQQVQRLLASLEQYEQKFGAKRPLWLIDDSRDSDAKARNSELLKDYARRTSAPVQRIGVAASTKLAKLAAQAVPEAKQAVQPLLVQQAQTGGGGRGWNLALLLTAGRRLVLLDEDFEFPLRRHPAAMPGMNLDPDAHNAISFYQNLDDALAAGTEFDDDPFELHLACAGQELGAVATQAGLGLDRQSLRGLSLTDLQHFSGSKRVLTTLNGTRGASASEAVQWLYTLDSAARAEFTRDRDAYLHNIEAQTLWSGYAQAHPVRQAYLTPFAIDNSVMLPCTAAAGRREDALFHTLARFCHPDAVALNLPLSIGHIQEQARRRSQRTLEARTPHFTEFLYENLWTHLSSAMSTDPVQRLHLAAAWLEDLAAASSSDRIAHLREYLNYTRASLIANMQQQLVEARDAPVFWQTDVRSIIETNARAMLQATPPRLGNWPENIDADDCARLLSENLRSMASALHAWPQLWAWAQDRGGDLVESL